MWDKLKKKLSENRVLVGLSIFGLLIVIQLMALGRVPEAPAGTQQSVVQLPRMPDPQAGADNQREALGNTLTALDQISQAYNLSPEQKRDIQRIIENANYAP